MSRKRTPRSCSQRTAGPESSTRILAISGSPRPSVTRRMSARNSSAVYGSRSVAANRSSSSTTPARSSRPACARRIAPAVNAELPPDHSGSAFSSTSRRQPRSRAACAADMPAFPAPTTMTSKSTSRYLTGLARCHTREGSHRMGARAVIGAVLAVAAVVAIAAPGGSSGDDLSKAYPSRQVSIMAPAAPGGGWDTTARAFQSAARDAKVGDESVEVFNVEGAGGTLGLSQLVSKSSGDPYELMMTGQVMLGAIETNKADVKLDKTTPIATLITETEAIVVPAKSRYRTLKDLLADFKRDPGSIRWAGGSAGSTDQLLVGLLAKTQGADPAKTKYVAHSGGGEANAAILSGSVDAGATGLSEVVDQVKAGKMRLLAVSSPVNLRIDGKKPPTVKEAGVNLEMTNWRALTAPPGISDSERARITDWVTRVMRTPKWRENLE